MRWRGQAGEGGGCSPRASQNRVLPRLPLRQPNLAQTMFQGEAERWPYHARRQRRLRPRPAELRPGWARGMPAGEALCSDRTPLWFLARARYAFVYAFFLYTQTECAKTQCRKNNCIVCPDMMRHTHSGGNPAAAAHHQKPPQCRRPPNAKGLHVLVLLRNMPGLGRGQHSKLKRMLVTRRGWANGAREEEECMLIRRQLLLPINVNACPLIRPLRTVSGPQVASCLPCPSHHPHPCSPFFPSSCLALHPVSLPCVVLAGEMIATVMDLNSPYPRLITTHHSRSLFFLPFSLFLAQ